MFFSFQALVKCGFWGVCLLAFSLALGEDAERCPPLSYMTPEEQALVQTFASDQYTVVPVVGQGLFYIDQETDCVKKVLKSGRPWEPHLDALIRAYVRPGTNVLDIGAHVGTHTMTLAQMVGSEGRVWAFEPQKKIYKELVMNLQLNKKQNVIAHHWAIGNAHETMFLGKPILHNEGARFISFVDPCEPVEMKTIDSLNLTNISFVKIDVENFELEVLKGAMHTLVQEKPTILIEIQGNHVQAASVSDNKVAHMQKMRREVIQFLEKMGYRVTHVSCDDYLALYMF